jgi:hypothetical protein
MADPESLGLSFIMVADAAQSVAGKVYILGGGWDRLLVPELPGPPMVPFYVAVGLTVPWHLTNRKFAFSIELEDADGSMIAPLVAGEAEVGRPPGLRPGTPQAIHFAGPTNPVFPSEGRYVLVCRVDGEPLGHTAIEVLQGAPQPQPNVR